MKSAVLYEYDLKKAVTDTDWDITIDKKKLQDALHQVALKYSSYAAADTAQKGDILSAKLESDLTRYNRQLQLNLGSGLFDKELEDDMLGKSTGKAYSVHLSGTDVTYEILEISRLVVPELTDEMAKKEGIPGVETVAQLIGYYTEADFREQLSRKMNPFLKSYLEKCSFELSPEDIDFLDEQELERCRKIARSMGLVFDEMKGEQMQGAVGCENIDEFKTMIHGLNTENLMLALLGAQYCDVDTKSMTIPQMYDAADALITQIGTYAFACR